MLVLFKWLMRLTSAAVILAVLASVLIYYLASRSLPEYSKTLNVDGLSTPVEIVRDTANVPHIFADEDADVFFGLGYAHAQDRMWQMMIQRRTAQGRLSEIYGLQTLDTDRFMRHLGLYHRSLSSARILSPETLDALNAYSAGVNARISEVNDAALGRGAPEMFLHQMPIAPWRPADSVALLKLFGVQSSSALSEEILRAELSITLPDPERLRDIMPDAPGAALATLPRLDALIPATNALPRTAHMEPKYNALSPFPARGLEGASNAWAAAPERSASGGTLLASDPHMGLAAPGPWYLARIELSSGGVIGGTIPGIPAIVSGRSDQLGWGITAAHIDDADILIEKLYSADPNSYETQSGFLAFQTRPSIIQIADAENITLTLQETANGPVMPNDFRGLGRIVPPGHVATLQWSLLSSEDRSIETAINLMRAQNIDEAIAAGETYMAPALNLVLADQTRIAMKTIGKLPVRAANHDSQGRIPSLGSRAQNLWQDVLPFAQNPEFIDPEGGILGNTNNKLVDRPFPNHLSFHWGDTQRIQRWQRLMQSRAVHTRESFIEAQTDTVSVTARTLLPLIGADLWFTGQAARDGTPERQRQIALDLLAQWNGEMNEHWPEPLIYAAWMRFLQDRLIRDEIGPLADRFTHIDPVFLERVFRDVDGASAWCDLRQSTAQESCAEMARISLDDALIWLEENWGSQVESLRWGDAHEAVHRHSTLGYAPFLHNFVNIRQSSSGGDHTLNRGLTSGIGTNPFENIHAAGYRGVYDFEDPDSSVFIISTGQSGHFLSRHYDDMAQLWRRGEYIPMSLDEELARAAAVGITKLLPKPSP